jgi:hypothetical protein
LADHNTHSTVVLHPFPRRPSQTSLRQRGWVGLIGLLIALVIVAVLAQKMLKTYGLGGLEPAAKAAGEHGPRGAEGVSSAPVDPSGARVTPGAALERARALESTVQQQADDLNKRIDETSK